MDMLPTYLVNSNRDKTRKVNMQVSRTKVAIMKYDRAL